MNEEFDEEKFDELIEGFNELEFEERTNPTFLEIIRQPTRETTWSNILAFYFDPNKGHKLGDLMLKSFFEALGENIEITNLNTIKVCPESSTENRKRIDLVIEADNFIIGIENKVNHLCNNPFEDYANRIDGIANGRKKFNVILSKNHHDERGFVNLSYDSFIKYIKRNLLVYKANADPKYLTFLNDFLRNIENNINFKEMIEKKEIFNYFKDNYSEIKEVTCKFAEFKCSLEQKFERIHQAINLRELEDVLKEISGCDATIIKGEIGSQRSENGNDDEYLIYSIFINCGKTVRYDIYTEEEPYIRIYCCIFSDNGLYAIYESSRFDEIIEFSDDTKDAAHKIVNKIKEIIDNVFVE